LLTHAFPCSKVSLLHLALAVTRLQVATPFPPRARTNYVGVVARSPHIACVVHRALGRTVSRATCCPHHMLHCLSGALLVSHPLPVLLVAPPPVAHAISHHLSGVPSVTPPIARTVCRAICCTACHATCCPCCLLHHPSPIPSVMLPVAHAVSHLHRMLCAPSVALSIACMVCRAIGHATHCPHRISHHLSGHLSPAPVMCGDLYAEPGESKKNWCYLPALIGTTYCH